MLEHIDFGAEGGLSAKVLSFGVVGVECELNGHFNHICILPL